MEKLVNAYYQEWLKTNDPYESDIDFCEQLESFLPDYKFGLNGTEIIILKKPI